MSMGEGFLGGDKIQRDRSVNFPKDELQPKGEIRPKEMEDEFLFHFFHVKNCLKALFSI